MMKSLLSFKSINIMCQDLTSFDFSIVRSLAYQTNPTYCSTFLGYFWKFQNYINYLFEMLKSKKIFKEKNLVRIQELLALSQSTIGDQVFNN